MLKELGFGFLGVVAGVVMTTAYFLTPASHTANPTDLDTTFPTTSQRSDYERWEGQNAGQWQTRQGQDVGGVVGVGNR